ncbi:MAG: acyl-[acyl-carrier-protein] thioesterase [Cellulosilyticaceae bacterium]
MEAAISKHSKIFTMGFRDIDLTGRLRLSSLVDFMQETSGEHAKLLGVDYAGHDNTDNVFWIVSRAKMKMKTFPAINEKIRIETFPVGIEKLFAVRHFNIYNEKDEQIGFIIGYYVLLDCETHRPIRLKNLSGALAKLEKEYIGESLPKLKSNIVIEHEDKRKVRASEIDVNNHMNNAHYIRWTMDMFSTEEQNKHPINSIQTNYITPLLEGNSARIIRGVDIDGNTIVQGTSLDGQIVYWTSCVTFENK